MKGHIYIEGSDSYEDKIRCRQAFRTLLAKCGFEKRMPRLSPCGGRNATFDRFKTALAQAAAGDYIALLIDSEDPIADPDRTWAHLAKRDPSWTKPANATDEHVLIMTTCMETWIAAARQPSETRSRHDVQDKLTHATRNCPNAYAKGKRSFEILEQLDPDALMALPSFARAVRILRSQLLLQQ